MCRSVAAGPRRVVCVGVGALWKAVRRDRRDIRPLLWIETSVPMGYRAGRI